MEGHGEASRETPSKGGAKRAGISGEFRRKRGIPKVRGGLVDTILKNLADGVIVADREGSFHYFNPAAERILGLGLLNAGLEEWSSAYGCFLPDRSTPYPSEELPLARALRGERVNDVEIFIRNDRKPSGAWISVNGGPLYDESGEIAGGVVIFRDISRRRRAYEFARRLANAVERTADCIFITDAEGRIEHVNPAFEKTTGYSREEAIGQTPRILKSGEHDREFYAALWARILAGEVHTGTVINRRKNGELFHAEQTITPVKDRSGSFTHFVAVVRDITEQKKAEESEVEMRLAREVQDRLYPSSPPRVAGYDMAGAAFPATATCGDYFDFIPMAGGVLGIAVGDVSGHGLGPALLMAETRAYLRSLALTTDNLAEILSQLNTFLCEDTDEGRFVTLTLVRLEPASGRFVYASAGHADGYVLDSSGAVKTTLRATGMPLGLFPGRSPASSGEFTMDPGDLLLLMTDGLPETEGPGGEFLGTELVLEVVRSTRHLDARRIVDGLHEAARAFASNRPRHDDITIVACKSEAPR